MLIVGKGQGFSILEVWAVCFLFLRWVDFFGSIYVVVCGFL